MHRAAWIALVGGRLLIEAGAQTGTDAFPRTYPETSISVPAAERVPIFFPPYPPPLGRIAPRAAAGTPRYAAPPELAGFVCDFFYPALGTRLATKTLTDKLRVRVDAYHAAKLELQNELRAELDRLSTADPEARTAGLITFSRRQTPKIAELEQTAEQLRRDLITADQNWSAYRSWHLTENPRRGFSPIEIAQVMRAFAYYQNNLLPAQRRLLREISLELVFAADSTAAATAAQPYVFFPPEPARVLLPDDLSAETAAKFATYQTKKSALKKELYDAVWAADGASFAFLRANPLKALAEKQSGRLAELDTFAEDIRRGLGQSVPPRIERSPLPSYLDTRVTAMLLAFQNAQKEASSKVDAILARAKGLPMQATYRFEAESLRFVIVPTRNLRGRGSAGPATNSNAAIEEVRTQVSAVADEYGRRVAEILNEKESIRLEIAQSLTNAKKEEVERALLTAMRIAAQKETDRTFSDYRIAVFSPGLSPEQRRLLFDGVVERLDLPLPHGELQPTYRSNSW